MMTDDIQMPAENRGVKLRDPFVPHPPALEDKGIRRQVFFLPLCFLSVDIQRKKTMHEVDNKL